MPWRLRRFVIAVALFVSLVALFLPRLAWAAGETEACTPKECCVTDPAQATPPKPARVRLGMRLLRIDRIVEQEGYYAGEITLLYRWPPGALRPDLKPRNGVEVSVALDETKLH